MDLFEFSLHVQKDLHKEKQKNNQPKKLPPLGIEPTTHTNALLTELSQHLVVSLTL